MPSEPYWVTAAGVISLNARLVGITGEPHRLLNADLLGSACAKPVNHWAYGERDVANLATALLFGIARNHPFQQGNKRTAFAAMIGFLRLNGYAFLASDDVGCANHILAVLEGDASVARFAASLGMVIAAPSAPASPPDRSHTTIAWPRGSSGV